MDEDKWVVHILGLDDVIQHNNEISALRAANDINKEVAEFPRTDNSPFMMALAKNLRHESA